MDALSCVPVSSLISFVTHQVRPCFVTHQVVIGNEHDTSTSSYLLNIFTDEEVGAYIDIDASQCGNEARFVNDFHGTGADGPNAQVYDRRVFNAMPWPLCMHVLTTAPSPLPTVLAVL